MVHNPFDCMNKQQNRAIHHINGPCLVSAGPGSGKTAVIVGRIVNLILAHEVPSSAILAVTFTNKATNEMKDRVRRLLPPGSPQPIISTFHSFCVRLLRRDGDSPSKIRPGFTRQFNICDEDGQKAIIRSILKTDDGDSLDGNKRAASDILSQISHAKNLKQTPRDIQAKQLASIYSRYQQGLLSSNLLDFDDLLIEAVRLLDHNRSIRDEYNRRIQHMLVDEYQDTNRIQYELMRLLTQRRRNIFVVGDDDQCIYTWRGADIRNILDFRKDFPDAIEIKLEQNYRSTKDILEAAIAVVRNNRDRVDKTLWTQSKAGEKIDRYEAVDEYDEARFIASESARLLRQCPSDKIAVLYRTSFQSRVIEQALTRAGIPYSVLGGHGFFEHAEVRDIIAYLKLAFSFTDSVSFRRIVNSPRRGIGNATLKQIEDAARAGNTNLWTAASALIEQGSLLARAQSALIGFQHLIQSLGQIVTKASSAAAIEAVLRQSGYVEMLESSPTPEAQNRLANIHELLLVATEAEKRGESPTDFLDTASLTSSTDSDPGTDTHAPVTLMTLHSAKGLEFPVVFLAGLDEGLLPHSHAATPAALEEERRLCYVGMTRAAKRLILTRAGLRHAWDRVQNHEPSRFLAEIPLHLIDDLSPQPAPAIGIVIPYRPPADSCAPPP